MPSRAMIDTMSRLGILASVQPMFDGLWGGADGMYAARLGERWRQTNPFGALAEAGVSLAFGSDSPVTPLGPVGSHPGRRPPPRRRAAPRPSHGVRRPHGWRGRPTTRRRPGRPRRLGPGPGPHPGRRPPTPAAHRRRRPNDPPERGSSSMSTRAPSRTTGKLEPRPGHRQEGPVAGRQGRSPDRQRRQEAHDGLGRAGHAPPRRAVRRRPRRHSVGQPPRRRRPRRRRPRARRRRTRLGRAAPRRGRRPRRTRPEGVRRVGHLPPPRGPRRHPRPYGVPQGRRPPAYAGSTSAAASGSG